MSTSSRGNVDHIHAVERAVQDVSSSPAKIQHKTNQANDKPASRCYPSIPGEPSGVTLAEKTNNTKPSNDPAKSQQVHVYHVNEAFQESEVAGNVDQENGSNLSPNNTDGSEEF